MNPTHKENLIWNVFDRITPSSVKCKLCFLEMEFYSNNRDSMIVHIQIDHQSLWHGTLFLPNAMSPYIWLKLYDYCRSIDNIIQSNKVECKYCGEEFEFDNSQFPILLNHVKAVHPRLLLALSLLYS